MPHDIKGLGDKKVPPKPKVKKIDKKTKFIQSLKKRAY